MDIQERIAFLEEKLRKLTLNQDQLRNELSMIQRELQELKPLTKTELQTPPATVHVPTPPPVEASPKPAMWMQGKPVVSPKPWQRRFTDNTMEDLVGTNIINKVGIFVTVIGVFIGAKYAIDRDLISPAMRIFLGYAIALILCVIAYRLKPKYHNYSAVLMSGAVSIAYFITLIAYSFYQLMPQAMAFSLMLLITVSVVWMATWYDRKIIALLGQVGGYAIPLLLSGGYNTGELFAYLSIINIGLLYLSFRKDWKLIYYVAFCLSWLIFLFYLPGSDTENFFLRNTAFLTINFSIFYATFLGYKLIRKENYNLFEVAILLANAFFYYLLGYRSINDSFHNNNDYLIIFTLINSAIHFAIAAWVHKIKLTDNSVFLFILGLGISFATISVPIAFDGNATTIFWAIEACALTYIGYRTGKGYYLNLALAVLLLTVVSLSDDWGRSFETSGIVSASTITPFLNANFLSSVFVMVCIGLIGGTAVKNKNSISNLSAEVLYKAVPFAFIGLLYLMLNLEINKWGQFYFGQSIPEHAGHLTIIMILIYSLIYISTWLYLNVRYFKSRELAIVLLMTGGVLLFGLLTGGLNTIGELRRNYLADHKGPAFLLLGIRYGLIASSALMLYEFRENLKLLLADKWYFYIFNVVLLSFVCNEFIHWMDLGGYPNQYKLGLSIIGGLYALALVAAGIMKKQKHYRVTGIYLLALTLAKVVFYDLGSLSTVSKTIVLIILGAIMLAASFLYNKYKDTIFTDADSEEHT